MSLSLGLGLSLRNRGGAAAFTPADIGLTAWWKASFAASPWVDAIGAKTATEATNPPAVGAAVNGFTPADFDGVNDKLTLSSTYGTYLGLGTFSGFSLVRINAVTTNDATPRLNDSLVSTTGTGRFGIYFRTNGTALIHVFATTGEPTASVAFTPGSFALLHWDYNLATTTLRMGLNGTWGTPNTSANAGNATNAGAVLQFARNSNDDVYCDMDLLEIGFLAGARITDAQLTGIRAYALTRYGIVV